MPEPPKQPEQLVQPPTADATAPSVQVTKPAGKLTAALKKGQPVTVSCDEACSIDARLVLRGKAVASGKGTLKGAGKAKVVLRFTKAGAKALKKKRSVRLTLRVTVKDAAGNASAKNVPVTLKG